MGPSLCKQVHKVRLLLYIGLYPLVLLLLVLDIRWKETYQPYGCALSVLVSRCNPAELVSALPHVTQMSLSQPSLQSSITVWRAL